MHSYLDISSQKIEVYPVHIPGSTDAEGVQPCDHDGLVTFPSKCAAQVFQEDKHKTYLC